MKDICAALVGHLGQQQAITNLVKERIYPVILTQSAPLPAIVYSPVLANYDSALQGDTGFVRQTIQFVCHGKTFKMARELSRLVKTTLQDFHGDMDGLHIEAVFIKSDIEYNGNSQTKFDTEEFMESIEFEFHYNEK